MRLSATIAGALALILIVAGCGGGSDDDGGGGGGGEATTAAPLSKAEFVKKADEACTKGGKETGAEIATYLKEKNVPKGKGPSEAQAEELLEEIVFPELRSQIEEIRGFGIPADDELQVEFFLRDVEAVVEKGEEDLGKAVQSFEKELVKADKQIQGYFKVCGQRK